ncbi:hypothetical protein [Vibrio atypicus]|uniref:hypothetical protein n=1 Tax=Vibrio atypicus TaxID=558271 RepID=UPI001358AA00|nr:hypothetical protein [Vibrio atypicus]
MKLLIKPLFSIGAYLLTSLIFASSSYADDTPQCVQGQALNVAKSWKLSLYGTKPKACLNGCRFNPQLIVELPSNDSASASSFVGTGEECEGTSFTPGGYIPPPIISDDLNGNGIHDDIDDFDGDGIPNSVDDDPFQKVQYLTDENQNGIPDELEPFLQELNPEVNIQEVNCTTAGCPEHMATLTQQMTNIAKNNADLVRMVQGFVSGTVMKDDIQSMSKQLAAAIRQQTAEMDDTKRVYNYRLGEMLEAIKAIDFPDGSETPQGLTPEQEATLNAIKNDTFTLQINDQINTNALGAILRDTSEIKQNIEFLPGDVSQQVSNSVSDLLDRGVKLKRTQVNQLKNASAAKGNATKIQEAKNQINAVDGKLDALTQLINDLDLSGGDGTSVDLSGVTGAINNLGNSLEGSIDGLSADVDGIGKSLTNIESLLDGDSKFQVPEKTDLFQNNFLFSDEKKAQIEQEIKGLETELVDEMDNIKSLFSIDTDSFLDGDYKEHTLDLRLSDGNHSFKTGVLDALVQNAEIIKAVILFIFVLMGIRMLGGD